MNRRGFLFGLGAAVFASPAIVRAAALMPVRPWGRILFGDGLHDDAEAINALIRGEQVASPNGTLVNVVPEFSIVPPGEYRLASSIQFPIALERFIIRDCAFMVDPGVVGFIHDEGQRGATIERCIFDGGSGSVFCT